MAYDKTIETTKKITADQKMTKYLAEWQRGKEFVDVAIRDFKRLDTIANAQYEGGSAKNPNVGDTTVAGIVRQIMRTAVKKMPRVTISINGSENSVEAIICKNRVEKVLLNPITFGKGFINTLQLGGRGSISRGFNLFQVTATKMYTKFGVTPKLIHFNDFAIEPGVQDGSHSRWFYIRTKWTPGKLDDVIAREEAKPDGQSTYNIIALKALRSSGPDSSGAADYAQYITPVEQSKVEAGTQTFDIITRYPIGTSDAICTFSPGINQILREVRNKSKFGFPRTLFLVIDPAELSPFGDSRVRLASPNQNFMMALRQNVASTWLYNSKPTLVQAGMFSGAVSLKSGGVIKSSDSNAKITPLTLDTTTAQQYPNIRKDITEQIQVAMGMNPGGSLGAIGESKTGIGAQKQAAGIDDAIQQVTNIIQEFLCQYILSGIDLYLSEQDGKGIIYVDDQTKQQVMLTHPEYFPFPENPNAMEVDWTKLYEFIEEIDVTVDTTMSKQEWTDEKRKDMQDAVTVAAQTANPNDPAAMAKKDLLQDQLIKETAPELAPALDAVGANTPVAASPDLTQIGQ